MSICRKSLGEVTEKTYQVAGRVCDKAGNCSETHESALVVYDATPPVVPSNDPGSVYVLDPNDAQAYEGTYYARTNLYSILLQVGEAQQDNSPLMDPSLSSVSVAEIYGWRMGFNEDLSREPWAFFETHPTANQERSVRGLGLPFGESERENFHRVYGCCRECFTAVFIYIDFDTEAPNATFSLNGGAKYTNDPNVVLTITTGLEDDDVAEVQISGDGDFENAETRALPLNDATFSLPVDNATGTAEDGEYTVYVRLADRAGNVTERFDSIILDTTPPQVGSVTVDDDSGYVLDFNAEVQVSCYDAIAGAGELTLDIAVEGASSGTVGGTGYESGRYLDLVELSLGEAQEEKTLSVVCSDPAGNLSETKSVTVTLDSEAPVISNVALNNGEIDAPTNEPVGVVSLTVTDAVSGVALLALSETDSCDDAAFVYPNSSEISYLLSSNDGQKQVYVCAKDMAGHVAGPVGSNTVLLDTVAPSNPTLSLTGGEWQTSSVTSVSLSAVDASEMWLEGDIIETADTFNWVPYANTVSSLAFSEGDGLKIGGHSRSSGQCLRRRGHPDQCRFCGTASECSVL